MNTLSQIRLKYPKPRSSHDAPSGMLRDYCIGGAVCWFAGMDNHTGFPESDPIACALEHLNPNLDFDAAWLFASSIIAHNDEREFDLAWQEVKSALSV